MPLFSSFRFFKEDIRMFQHISLKLGSWSISSTFYMVSSFQKNAIFGLVPNGVIHPPTIFDSTYVLIMYIYVCMCVCVCVCMYVYVCVYVYIYIYIYIYVCMYVYIYTHIYIYNPKTHC